MKPIEPGCLALVTEAGVNGGKVVTVGNFIGQVSLIHNTRNLTSMDKDYWEVDQELEGNIVETGQKFPMFYCRKAYLLRIDGFEPEQEETTSTILENIQ